MVLNVTMNGCCTCLKRSNCLKPRECLKPRGVVIASHQGTRTQAIRQQARSSRSAYIDSDVDHWMDRRSILLAGGMAGLAMFGPVAPPSAGAFEIPPAGYRLHVDKLDGYSFFYPEDWIPVTTSGNDVFYRNPFDAEENLFVDISSPSSSRYASVTDLGSPEEAASRTRDQYLEEFMSTRLGVKRTAEIESAVARIGADGKQYYDIQTRLKSYASRNQLAVTQGEIDEAIVLEFDRRYLSVLGTASNRLYEFRLQTGNDTYLKDPERLLKIATSFKCKDVDI